MNRILIPTALLLTGLVLAGCATPAPTDNQPPPGAAPEANEGLEVNEHGNLQKDLGEVGAVVFPGTEREAITFKVTAIEKDPECTGDPVWYMPPENGLFVSLTFEITTADDYLEIMGAKEPLRLFYDGWQSYTPDGAVVENTSRGLTGCFPEEENVPLDIPAGATSTGKYVLDVATDAVSVAWHPAGIYGIGVDDGWEWALD